MVVKIEAPKYASNDRPDIKWFACTDCGRIFSARITDHFPIGCPECDFFRQIKGEEGTE